MNGAWNDFVIGNGSSVSAMENETLEQQTNGLCNNFGRIVDSASQDLVIGKSNDDNFREAADNAVMTVENYMHDAILTARGKVVIHELRWPWDQSLVH